ncbi:hypothetical protein [Rhodobacter sp. 24-YEA-8]|uniref:phage head spike fiber domain-containing protein n=1 Tax=Rhodobacter sp. 24-YEA-8 TaxID=1884310 RepID=UPI000894BB49|nr:hypothetical protein [Rhodobacter sp. 24-YEA-8]SEB51353.1 hypothetical protein SAMN05519105_0590 [Rhodobacter sp. 24-YEA-8]
MDGVVKSVGLPKVLLPYQVKAVGMLNSVRDCSALFIERRRRVGLTWGLASYAALRAARQRTAGGMDMMYISYSREMTREFIDACAMWARAFNIAAGDFDENVPAPHVDAFSTGYRDLPSVSTGHSAVTPDTGRHPKGGRRNLYQQTDIMTSAAGWEIQDTPTQDGPIASPWEGELAYLFTNIAGRSTFLRPPGGDNLLRGTPYVRSIRAKLISAAPPSSIGNIIALEQTLGSGTAAVRFDMLTGTILQTSAGAVGEIVALGDGWHELTAKFTTAVSGGSEPGARVIYIGNYGASDSSSTFAISMPQLEEGSLKSPYQRVTTVNDITEAGKPYIWHLWNDGGDSLNAPPLPADTYGLAYVDVLGGVTITTVVSDGTTPINLLRAERQAQVILRQGAFTAAEETQIRSYWGGLYV